MSDSVENENFGALVALYFPRTIANEYYLTAFKAIEKLCPYRELCLFMHQENEKAFEATQAYKFQGSQCTHYSPYEHFHNLYLAAEAGHKKAAKLLKSHTEDAIKYNHIWGGNAEANEKIRALFDQYLMQN